MIALLLSLLPYATAAQDADVPQGETDVPEEVEKVLDWQEAPWSTVPS